LINNMSNANYFKEKTNLAPPIGWENHWINDNIMSQSQIHGEENIY
jgi:hypothetical protein